MKNTILVIILFYALSLNLFAQEKTIFSKIEDYQKAFPTEKIYLSFDRPYYNLGDTLWFKSFLLNSDFIASTRSIKIYVELYNDSLQLVENKVIALNNGLGYGDFTLKRSLKEGTYSLRAYTNWQQNFGSSYFYQKSFYLGNAGEKTWLLDSYQQVSTQGNTQQLDLKVKITNIRKEAVGLKDLEVTLLNDKKKIMHTDLQTTAGGIIETTIPLGANKINGNYNLLITDKKDKSRNVVLPISLQETDEIDLQFMPEGGNLVNGIYGKVAFKAVGVDGMGKAIEGKIVDGKNQEITSFSALHKGMGSFFLLPQKEERYTAVYTINKREVRQSLPKVKEEGTALRIDHLSNPDSMLVYIRATESKSLNGYHLIAQEHGNVLFDAPLNLSKGFISIKLPKKDFPDGIILFTLFSPDHTPVNERQAFINHTQKINLQIVPHKSSYNLRDSISLEITATKEDGTPATGSFSVSVTDNNQVKQVTNEENIVSYFLLQSDLRGNIEDIGWYFDNNEPSTFIALDYLLLTQAWIAYNWQDQVKFQSPPKFTAESEHKITGKLTDLLNKPVANINLSLLAFGKTIFMSDTISNANGDFTFAMPTLDSAAYTIKIKNSKGKTSSAKINVNEFTPAPAPSAINRVRPWYINPDSTFLNHYKNVKKIQSQDTTKLKLSGNQLKQVEIKGKAKAEQRILNAAWDAYPIKKITEEDLKKIPHKTLMDLLKEKIPGFTIGSTYANGCFGVNARSRHHDFTNFLIGSSLISHVIIDKINTHIVSCGVDDRYNQSTVSATAIEPDVFFTNEMIFNALNASDIKEITVLKTCAYYMLDITTRSGRGPWISISKGTYVFRPIPISVPKEFYSPKYPVKKDDKLSDLRPTIFWDANLVTDEKGKATVSFYSTDQQGSYTIKVQGSDMMGRFGFQKGTVKIVANTASK
jgi:hypothetical protein